jgi:hypothetical protein
MTRGKPIIVGPVTKLPSAPTQGPIKAFPLRRIKDSPPVRGGILPIRSYRFYRKIDYVWWYAICLLHRA